MAYQYTDEELNRFNRHEAVYSVDPSYAKAHNHKTITTKSDEDLDPKSETNTITVGGQEFRVVKTGDYTNGFQGMAVAPVDANGKVDTSSVAIIAAGTNPKDPEDLGGAGAEWLSSLSNQYYAADDFYKQVEAEGYKVTQLSGYSQSAYMLKVGSKHHVKAIVFNGWFNYDSLSEKEKKYIDQHPEAYVNYRKKDDKVTQYNVTGNASKTHGTVVYVKGSSHDITAWQFKKGQIIDQNGHYVNILAVYGEIKGQVAASLEHTYTNMKSRLSAGGYSAHETIFLDYEQASTVASGLGETAQTGCEQVKGYRDAAVQEAEDLWKEINKRPAFIEKLSDEEIMAIFAEEGVTYDSIVNSVAEHFDSKVKASQDLEESFADLGRQIETGMQEMTARDNTLAGEIKGWIGGK